jgi:hypothetical protein
MLPEFFIIACFLTMTPSPSGTTTADCPREADRSWTDNPMVGVFGTADEIERAEAAAPWASFTTATLADGREGRMFIPADGDRARYDAFVRDAKAGRFGQAQVAWLDAAPARER